MNRLLLILLLHLSQIALAQNVSSNWAKGIGGIQQEVGKAIATDNQGNTYTAGYFTGTADFDPGGNLFNLTSVGMQDIFIVKLDAIGNFVWAKRFGGVGNDIAYSVALDSNKNVYTTGFFRNIVDFDPGASIYNVSTYTTNSQDIFISKLDANGNFVWAKNVGGTGYLDSLGNTYDAISCAYGLCIDEANNIYTTGSYLGTIDFDPGINVYTQSALSVANIFVSKLSSNGDFIWAKSMGENKHGDEAYAIAADNMGNVYTTGVFGDTADFDPGPLVFPLIATSFSASFISKLDSLGNFVWAKQLAGNTSSDQSAGYAIDVSSVGEVYVGGHFKGIMDSDPNSGINLLTSHGNYDIFLCKLTPNGNHSWAKNIGGAGADYCYDIQLDTQQHIYVGGSFKGMVDFNTGVDTFSLTSFSANTDGYIVTLNESGNFINAYQLGGVGNDAVNAITTNQNGQLLAAGFYTGIADLDPTSSSLALSAIGSLDAFILSLNQQGMILPITLSNFSGIQVASGNLLKWATKNEINSAYIEVQKSNDALSFYPVGIVECLDVTTENAQYNFLDNKVAEQTNYYRLKMIDQDQQYSYSHILTLENSIDQKEMVLFPNPSSGMFSVRFDHEIKNGHILIRNSQGAIVLDIKDIHGSRFDMNLSHLDSGTYFLELLTNGTNKFLRKNNTMNNTTIQLIR